MSIPVAYEVKLDAFEGPLDLLLHLVVKHEMDIYDIPMAQITAQYLAYLAQMEEQNLDIASEFLLMAATLIHIKSKMLLPTSEPEDLGEEEVDPRVELVQRLLEYRRYKDGAEQLSEYPQLDRDVFVRPDMSHLHTGDIEGTVDVAGSFGDVGLFELVEALRDLLKGADEPNYHEICRDELTIADATTRLLRLLKGREQVPFHDCFLALPGRAEIIVMFIAVLELVKLHGCKIVQLNPRGTIYIYPVSSVLHGIRDGGME